MQYKLTHTHTHTHACTHTNTHTNNNNPTEKNVDTTALSFEYLLPVSKNVDHLLNCSEDISAANPVVKMWTTY